MEKTKILIVDDEQAICEIVAFNLALEGYEVKIANSAVEAIASGIKQFNLILLDVMMREISGFEFARIIKADNSTKNIPIIFITAKDSEDDVLKGFEIGADDYIEKPFSIKELIARIKAVLARSKQPAVNNLEEISYKTLVLNLQNTTLYIDGEKKSLTRLEFELLKLFLTNKGTLFSRQQIIANVWPKSVYVSQRTVDVTITRLRRKLGPYASNIITKTGFGYTFE